MPGVVTIPGVVAGWVEGVEEGRGRCRSSSSADSDACAVSTPTAALSLPPPHADRVTKRSRFVTPLRQSFLIVGGRVGAVIMVIEPLIGG